MAAERVCDYQNVKANTISGLHPFLYRCCPDCGQILNQVPVLSKDGPQNIRHRKTEAHVWDIGEGSPLLPLPQQRGSMPTTRTCPRFARVLNDFLLGF